MFLKNGKVVLTGDGTYPGMKVVIDGDDLVLREMRATYWGDPSDVASGQDNGITASGVNTADNPNLMACSLPMDFGPCKGSAIPKLPWALTPDLKAVPDGTMVRVYNPLALKQVLLPLIELGPSPPPHANALLDLTRAAFLFLGGDIADGSMTVDYRVLGAVQHLPVAVRNAAAQLLGQGG